jgi:hypothetical protein
MAETIYDWVSQAVEALDLTDRAGWTADPATVTWVLDLARDVAHSVARPAAPVGSFLAGVAVGLAGAQDPLALDRVRERLIATLPAIDGPAAS